MGWLRSLGRAVLALSFVGCTSLSVDAQARTPAIGQPGTERLLVITATRTEFDAVARRVQDGAVQGAGPSLALEGRLGGSDVVVLQSGVSIVNAAMTTQWALDQYPVRAIVVSGTAAGLDPDLSVGDVVIAEQWGKYNEIFFLRETDDPGPPESPFGEPLPFAPYALMAPRPARPLPSTTSPARPRFWFPADTDLLARAQESAAKVTLATCWPETLCLDHTPSVHLAKAGVSGSVFMDNVAFGRYLRDIFGASIVEMETAAIAIVAAANTVPFIAIRAVSDMVRPTPSADHQYVNYHALAAENAARVAEDLVAAFER